MKKLIASITLVMLAGMAQAGGGALVDNAFVKANSCKSNFIALDIRGKRAYSSGHVPCAVATNYGKDGWRVKANNVPGVLPPVADMEKLIGSLGIGNNTHVIVLAHGNSAADMAAGTRVYWTFKVLGHKNVHLLNGGMAGWAKAKMPRKTDNRPANAKRFKADFQPNLLATKEQVYTAMNNGASLLDSRPTPQYLGIHKSGKVKRAGTIPGSFSLPGLWTTINGGGTLHPAEALRLMYQSTNTPTKGKQVVYCNTGHWASLGWFVSYELIGNKGAVLYDASMAEWTFDMDKPVEAKIKL